MNQYIDLWDDFHQGVDDCFTKNIQAMLKLDQINRTSLEHLLEEFVSEWVERNGKIDTTVTQKILDSYQDTIEDPKFYCIPLGRHAQIRITVSALRAHVVPSSKDPDNPLLWRWTIRFGHEIFIASRKLL